MPTLRGVHLDAVRCPRVSARSTGGAVVRPLVVSGQTDARRRSRASKQETSKEHRIELRASKLEREAWILAATREGYLGLSDWIRDRLNGAARSRVLLSSDHQAWNTPAEILEALAPLGRIALDPCGNATSIVRARTTWTIEDDGLSRSWSEAAAGGLVFVNPPFDEAPVWIARCAAEARAGAEVVALVPARVDVRWWERALKEHAIAGLWRGRVRFGGAANAAPFPIALLYWGSRQEAFCAAVSSRCVSFVVHQHHQEQHR